MSLAHLSWHGLHLVNNASFNSLGLLCGPKGNQQTNHVRVTNPARSFSKKDGD